MSPVLTRPLDARTLSSVFPRQNRRREEVAEALLVISSVHVNLQRGERMSIAVATANNPAAKPGYGVRRWLTRWRIFSGRKGRIMAKTGWKKTGSLSRWIPRTFRGKESWRENRSVGHQLQRPISSQHLRLTDSTEEIFLARNGFIWRAWPKLQPSRSKMTFRPRL